MLVHQRVLGLPHFDSKSWDWWEPITEMPHFFHRLVDDTCNWEANGIPPPSMKCSVWEVSFLLTVRPCVGQLSYTISSWASSPWFLVGYCHKWQVFWIPKLWLILKGTLLPLGLKSRQLALISICYSTSLVSEYSSSSTVFWPQLMGFIFWCLPENMVPP